MSETRLNVVKAISKEMLEVMCIEGDKYDELSDNEVVSIFMSMIAQWYAYMLEEKPHYKNTIKRDLIRCIQSLGTATEIHIVSNGTDKENGL